MESYTLSVPQLVGVLLGGAALGCWVSGCADLLDLPSDPHLATESDMPLAEAAPSISVKPMEHGPAVVSMGGSGATSEGGEANAGGGVLPVVDDSAVSAGDGVGASAGDGGTAPSAALDAGSAAPDAASEFPGVPEDPACVPSGSLGPDGRCYAEVATLLSWDDARDGCIDRGAGWDLAAVRSEAVNRFMAQLLTGEVWIGASDADADGQWLWVSDGQRFWTGNGLTGSAVDGAYESWNSDEPNGGGNSDCARLLPRLAGTTGGLPVWADLECFEERASVCEGPAL